MSAPVPPREGRAPTHTWEQIELVVEQFASAAQSEMALAEFAEALLSHLQRVVPASGLQVGVCRADGTLESPLASRDFSGCQPEVQARDALTAGVAERREVLARTWSRGEQAFAQAFVPLREREWLRIDALLLPDLSADEASGVLRLLRVFGEVAEDYLRRRELVELRERAGADRGLSQLLLRLHGSLDLVTIAYAIANDGRHWLGCDRISVCRWQKGSTAAVLAVSGVDTVNHRAEDVRRLADLSAASAQLREAIYWSGKHDEHSPPQLVSALDAHLDRSHAQRLAVVPLTFADTDSPTAVIVVEWFQEQISPQAMRSKVEALALHSGVAWQRGLEHDLPLLGWFVGLRRARSVLRRRSVWASLAVSAAVVAALCIIPANFKLEAQGTLQPSARRHLFAPADGIVESILVEHGDTVTRGHELLKMRDVQLDFEVSRIGGDLQTTRSRLDTVRAQRSSRSSNEGNEHRTLAAEEEQLKERIVGLEAQLKVLHAMQEELRVTSPIDGQILTWHARDLLSARPVKRGQLLLTIADAKGPWELELRLPDADAGHLLAAQKELEDRPVSFLLATNPAQTRHGVIENVALDVDSSDGRAPSILVTVRIDADDLRDARAGAGVIARIDCGQKPIGYVWLHDVIDAVRSRLLF